MKKVLFAMASLFLLSCKEEDPALKIGVTAGPHAIIMDQVKALCEEAGLKVKVIEFNDFIQPNAALSNKELDLNAYQHEPFLREQIENHKYDFVNVGKTVLMPMGLYSKKIKKLRDIAYEGKIAIPNDPTNGGRALLFLQSLGLIKLKDKKNSPTIHDIVENTKKLDIIEIEAPQLPRLLPDVDAAIINTDWIILSGMKPSSAIEMESKNSPYVNILVTRNDLKNDERVQKFIKIYQSNETAKFIREQFRGAVIPGF
jgi:D-methionine transport system substrate-binding protein